MLEWFRKKLNSTPPAPAVPPPVAKETKVEPSAQLALALQHEKAGRFAEAASACESILIARPDDMTALCALGRVRTQQGKFDAAAAAIDKALAQEADNLEPQLLKGRLLLRRGNSPEAKAIFTRILNADPNHAGAHHSLGNVFMGQGKLDTALDCFSAAIANDARYAEPHCNIGVIHESRGAPEKAMAAYKAAVAINPELANAHFNLAVLLMKAGKRQEALHHIEKVMAINPMSADAWDINGRLRQLMGDYPAAIQAYERALSIDPGMHEVLNSLGLLHQLTGNHKAGIEYLRSAVARSPGYVEARSNLGTALMFMGQCAEGLSLLSEAARQAPDAAHIHSNYLFNICHDETATAQEIFAAHQAFGKRFEDPLRTHWPRHDNTRDPQRKLKIGFVSADLYAHAVATFVEPIWSAIDKGAFEIWVYANQSQEDEVTQRLKAMATTWRVVRALSDADLAKSIRDDGIDILFDLSGHSAGNRLLAFARKPAPIQITWIGHPNTTGLLAMDYYLADRFGAPPGLLDPLFTEKIVRLASSAVFKPLSGAPAVGALPALQTGGLTFGSFARSNKITTNTVALWCRVLNAVPGSRMTIGGLSDASRIADIQAQFASHGVTADRLVCQPRMDMNKYLALHGEIDMILDTYPFGGGTTSCHALWMGVPILTLAGDTMSSRVGAIINGQVQLTGFTVDSEEDFVAQAVHWSKNLSELARIRDGLRARTAESALCQPTIVARSLETALRQMWATWCDGQAPRAFSTDNA